jgi:hypothetical protein
LLLEARFADLEDAAGASRAGRKRLAPPALRDDVTVIITALLPPEAADHILAVTLDRVEHLVRAAGEPPQLSRAPMEQRPA